MQIHTDVASFNSLSNKIAELVEKGEELEAVRSLDVELGRIYIKILDYETNDWDGFQIKINFILQQLVVLDDRDSRKQIVKVAAETIENFKTTLSSISKFR